MCCNNKTTRYAANLQTAKTPDSVIAPSDLTDAKISPLWVNAVLLEVPYGEFGVSNLNRLRLTDSPYSGNFTPDTGKSTRCSWLKEFGVWQFKE